MLPYLAVGANAGLLTVTAYSGGADVGAVSTGTILVLGLVALRQVFAQRDTNELSRRCDARSVASSASSPTTGSPG
jgi:hypothetical protein